MFLEGVYGPGGDVTVMCPVIRGCKRSWVSVKATVITEEVNASGSPPQHLVEKTEKTAAEVIY